VEADIQRRRRPPGPPARGAWRKRRSRSLWPSSSAGSAGASARHAPPLISFLSPAAPG